MRPPIRPFAVLAAIGAALLPLTGGHVMAQSFSRANSAPLDALAAEVRADSLKADLTRLVRFGTRHTASDVKSEKRGIGAARRWVEAEFRTLASACGGCLEIALPEETFTSDRLPNPTKVVDVLAIQRGTSDPGRVIIISGHIDSRVSDVLDAKSDAPGANDDGSGTVAVLQAARVLSKHRFPATLVYAVLSGEEQGLFGGKILADYAKAQGWRVEAVLNNDIIGNIAGSGGAVNSTRVRVFAEGTKATETPEQANRRRYNGGEVDSPARNLARFLDRLAAERLPNLDVAMIYRTDRFGRGGDQVRMLESGFPAVRLSEGAENYDRQHQDIRYEGGRPFGDTLDGVDFPYLAQVTRLNVLAMAAMALAPAPPENVRIEGAVKPDTLVSWQAVPGAAGYRVWRRETTAPNWEISVDAPAEATSLMLPGIVIDDWFFGVSAVSADGQESPVVFPGPAGAFFEPAAKAAPGG